MRKRVKKKGHGVDNNMQDKHDKASPFSGVMGGSDPIRHDEVVGLGQYKESKRKMAPLAPLNGAQAISLAIGLVSLGRDKGLSLQTINKDKGHSNKEVAQRKNPFTSIKGKKDFTHNRATLSSGSDVKEVQTQPFQSKQQYSEPCLLQEASTSFLDHTNGEA